MIRLGSLRLPVVALVVCSLCLVALSGKKNSTEKKEKPDEAGTHSEWITSFEKAKAKAESENKDILMNFTGSDWCQFCILLEREVFSTQLFADFANKNFVLLELDFPQDDSEMTKATIEQNEKLREKFNIEGFPTILLTDAKGRPFYKTSYQPGGSENYVEHLTELKTARIKRDKAFGEARKLKGVARARKLDDALTAVDSQLLFPVYEKEVKEIVKLDAENKGGFKERYGKLIEQAEFKAITDKIVDVANETQELKRVLAEFVSAEKKFANNPELVLQLNMLKVRVLDFLDEDKLVIGLLTKILKDKKLDAEIWLELQVAKLSAHAKLEEFDKALLIVNTIIAKIPDKADLDQIAQLMIMKARLLKELGQIENAKSVIVELRKTAGPDFKESIDRIERDLFPDEPENEKSKKSTNSPDAKKPSDNEKPAGGKEPETKKPVDDKKPSTDGNPKSDSKAPTSPTRDDSKHGSDDTNG